MKTMEANGQQTLLDIALQHCGTAEAVFAIAELNSISPDIVPCHGDIVTLPDMVNKKVVNYYSANKIVPATANLPVFGISLRCSGGGTVGISHNTATAGTVVTLTATPDNDYVLSEITIAGASDLIVPTDNGNGTFSFVMPASDVKIEVNFIQVSHSIALTIDGIGTVAASHDTATAGTVVTLTVTSGEGYELASLVALAEGRILVLTPGHSSYTFVMPTADVTVTATFAQVQQEPKWRLVTSVPQDLSGEYILAGMDGDEGWMFAGNLANYQGEMAQVEVGDNGTSIKQTEAAGARLVTIGDRRLVDSGTYGGTFSYTIAYQHSVNGKRYMTYSSSGLSNSSSNSGTNSRWHIEIDSNGRMTAINIGTSRCRLYMYASQLEHYLAQAVATNHDSIDTAYKPLSLFALEE